MMQTAITTQPQTTHTRATRWVKTRARSWAFSLFAHWHWQPAVTTGPHGQAAHRPGVPLLPPSTFSMLVESDVLQGRPSMVP